MKRTISLLLALVLCLGLVTGFAAAAGFPFADVPIYEWYFEDVKNAYDMNLINGKSINIFAPKDNLTYAEACKLAACMHQRYMTGSVTLQNGEPWYQSYIDYCRDAGIIKKEYQWLQPATRAGYIEIFANALPASALGEINAVADGSIPDVPMSHPQAGAIYKLYRAGVVQGNDDARSCSPASGIMRCEVATILSRMMDGTKRTRFTLGEGTVVQPKPEEEKETVKALKIKEQPESVSGKSGEEVILEVWIEGGKSPYTYTWLCGNENSAGVLNGKDGTWVSGGSRTESGSFFSKLHITLPASDEIIGDTIFCVIEDSAGQEVSSNKVTVTMEQNAEPMKIQSSLRDVTVLPGETAQMSIGVTGGTAPYKYRWEQYENNIWKSTGETSDTLSVKIPPAHPGGSQMYRCVVTDSAGCSITSDTARVIVEAAVPLTLTNAREAAGDLVNLTVFAEGGKGPYTFTWQGYANMAPTTSVKDWNGISIATGTTSSMLTVNTTKCSCTRYLCTVRDANGTAQTIEFTIG